MDISLGQVLGEPQDVFGNHHTLLGQAPSSSASRRSRAANKSATQLLLNNLPKANRR